MTEETETDYAKLTFIALVGYFIIGPLILGIIMFAVMFLSWLI